jgi:hypothetical protein
MTVPISGGLLHSKLQSDPAIRTRHAEPARVKDVEEFSPEFVARGFTELREVLGDIARKADNYSHPVDEYNTVPLTGASTESTLNLMPTYEYMPEKIQSILVAGPPGAAVTLILGDRQWPIIIPAAGILPIGPLALMLGRSDPRQLVSATPGTYFLELMGIADKRFDI